MKVCNLPGRPIIAATKKNIDALRCIVEEDGRYTISQVRVVHTLGISEGIVHHILTDHLKLKKLCARWVPHLLTPKHLEGTKNLLEKI